MFSISEEHGKCEICSKARSFWWIKLILQDCRKPPDEPTAAETGRLQSRWIFCLSRRRIREQVRTAALSTQQTHNRKKRLERITALNEVDKVVSGYKSRPAGKRIHQASTVIYWCDTVGLIETFYSKNGSAGERTADVSQRYAEWGWIIILFRIGQLSLNIIPVSFRYKNNVN